MPKAARPVPEGHQTVVPYLKVRGAAEAIEFYARAFGARELMRMPAPDGRLMHACLRIGDAVLYLSDEFAEGEDFPAAPFSPASVTIHLNVEDADAAWNRAMSAGAIPIMPIADMFWGDRYGQLKDPFGLVWSVSTQREALTPDEIGRRARAFFASIAPGRP